MNECRFGKDRYHQHIEMETWCRDLIGPGKWTYATPKTWEGMEDILWVMHSMFGITVFAFKDPKHLTLFLLRWT